MLRGAPEITFEQAKNMLFVLTGKEPIKTTGSIDKYHHGEHLRFVFDSSKQPFNLVKVLLKLLDIQHCADLFKNIEPREGPPVFEFYITVSKTQFAKLYSYFAPGSIVTLNPKDHKFNIADLRQELQAALLDVLFNPRFLADMKMRNQGKYNLDGLMFYVGQLLLNSAPCFAYLKENGVEAGFNVLLDLDEAVKDVPELSSEDEAAAITPMQNLLAKRNRGATAPNTDISAPDPKRHALSRSH